MEDLLVATILEELFKTSSRVFYKEHQRFIEVHMIFIYEPSNQYMMT